jgi:hypothetical protein
MLRECDEPQAGVAEECRDFDSAETPVEEEVRQRGGM